MVVVVVVGREVGEGDKVASVGVVVASVVDVDVDDVAWEATAMIRGVVKLRSFVVCLEEEEVLVNV